MLGHIGLNKNSKANQTFDKESNLSQLPSDILKQIERASSDLVTISDLSGVIWFVSDSVERVLGYAKQDLIGKSVSRYIMQDDFKNVRKTFQVEEESQQKYYLHFRHAMGKYIIFESVMKVITCENGEKKILTVSRDISDKKQAEEMLIRSEKMSIAGQLAAGIAHEIRNPLTSLRGFIQLLQAGMDNKQEYYKIMMDEIEKINTITSELLFISKPMTDEKNIENVKDMLTDVVTLLKTQAQLFNIELSLVVDHDISIHCDRSQMKQVFINLVKNAIEEMSDGGNIELRISQKENSCVIDVKDEGPGIPKHLLHKLKEPFFTTKKHGTGLGLMISNQIIENHHGHLEITSDVKKGSTFSIRLPIS